MLEACQPHVGTTQTLPTYCAYPTVSQVPLIPRFCAWEWVSCVFCIHVNDPTLSSSLYSCLTLILRCDQSWRSWLGRQWSRPCWRWWRRRSWPISGCNRSANLYQGTRLKNEYTSKLLPGKMYTVCWLFMCWINALESLLVFLKKKQTLFSLSWSQRQFEENRNAEMVETQRLEEQERRRREEKVWSLVDIFLLTLHLLL